LSKKKLAIAIPASVVSDTPHLREKTAKIGLIGRAAAIFRVDEIIVYPDDPKVNQTGEMNLIGTLLAYMETPQYLRKRLFRLEPQLRYAGILPPLRTPHHPLNRKMRNLKVGEYREGVTLSKTNEGMLVDIGVEKPALMLNKQLALNLRVTVKVVKVDNQAEVETVNRGEIQEYWGYTITMEKRPLGKLVKRKRFDLTIATSKYGDPIAAVVKELTKKLKDANTILVEFGAPTRGLSEIVRAEGLELNDVADFVVNTIPLQGTATVRTEEALIASLAIFNMQFGFEV
jgi:hypothetical protein